MAIVELGTTSTAFRAPTFSECEVLTLILTVELWHSIPRVAFLAFTKTNKILKEKLG
jgi:hypothetical protein